MSEPTEFGRWFVAHYPDIMVAASEDECTRRIARAAWDAANCAAHAPMPCGHPAACAMGSDEGTSYCRWCDELNQAQAEIARQNEIAGNGKVKQ